MNFQRYQFVHGIRVSKRATQFATLNF